MVRLSIILATSGRPSLALAAESAVCQMTDVDELILAGGGPLAEGLADELEVEWLDLPAGGDWGHTERNAAMPLAEGTHLLFVDDDDALLPGALAAVRAAIATVPDRPHVFRMIDPHGRILPERPGLVAEGHIGTPCLVAPNVPAKLGRWGRRYEGDFDFIRTTLAHYPDGPVWHPDVIYGCREHGARAWEGRQ